MVKTQSTVKLLSRHWTDVNGLQILLQFWLIGKRTWILSVILSKKLIHLYDYRMNWIPLKTIAIINIQNNLLFVIRNSWYLPGPAPQVTTSPMEVKILAREQHSPVYTFKFLISGWYYITISTIHHQWISVKIPLTAIPRIVG